MFLERHHPDQHQRSEIKNKNTAEKEQKRSEEKTEKIQKDP